jgi:hypothetical protein
MVPLVMRLPSPKAPKFAQWCVSAGIAHGGFEHFVAHGVESLAAYGSAKNTPAGATRVWVIHSRQSVHQNSGQPTCRSLVLRRPRPFGRSSSPRCLASSRCPDPAVRRAHSVTGIESG